MHEAHLPIIQLDLLHLIAIQNVPSRTGAIQINPDILLRVPSS